jgi:RNA polymerase sigma-70 factor (ECF subfamily)
MSTNPANDSTESIDQHLSQITTTWTVVRGAHAGSASMISTAQKQVLQRYGRAVYRYLLGATRNPDLADDLFQEFALRFVRGDMQRADPRSGRFRDYLKTTLYHLIVDNQRRSKRAAAPLTGDTSEPAFEESVTPTSDREFLSIWRAELMNRAWEVLAEIQRQTGQPVHVVLKLRTDQPTMKSPEMAEVLSVSLGRPVTSDWVRKRLFQAREHFTTALVDQVAATLDMPTQEALAQELSELGFLEGCRAALSRWRPSPT